MEITFNPRDESRRVLLALAAMLTTIAGEDKDALIAKLESSEGSALIGYKDRPDVGADSRLRPDRRYVETPQAEGRIERTEPDLAKAFGAGNVAGHSLTVPSPPLAQTGVALPSIPTPSPAPDVASPEPDLAAAFGGNKGTGPLVPPVGTPPVPSSGAATAGAPTPASVEVDSAGLPWDSRIHSSSKKKNAGTEVWSRRRNISDTLVAQVEAELRAAMSVPNVAATLPPPPPPAPTAIPLPPTTAGAAASSGISFAQVLPRVTSGIQAGTISPEVCSAILGELSGGAVTSVAMLAIAPGIIPSFWQRLDALGVA